MGNEPKVLYIGDRVSWIVTDPDHPSSTWSLAVYLRGRTTSQSFTGSADGSSSFAVTASIGGTETGSFSWFLVFSNSSDRITVPAGDALVYPNPAGSSFDPRSHARKVLDAIQSILEGRATKDEMSITINGRTLSRTPIEGLLKLRGIYRDEVAAEEEAVRVRQGHGSGRKIVVRL